MIIYNPDIHCSDYNFVINPAVNPIWTGRETTMPHLPKPEFQIVSFCSTSKNIEVIAEERPIFNKQWKVSPGQGAGIILRH